MPAIAHIRAQNEEESGDVPRLFDIPLYLPSAVVGKVTCDRNLMEYEWSLREAQALDALSDLRQHLLCRSHLWYDHQRNIRGQREGTRSWATLDALKGSIDMDAMRYRVARQALTVLSMTLQKGDSWKTVYQELHDSDIKGLKVDENDGTEGTMISTWIWKVPGLAGNKSDELQEGLSHSQHHDGRTAEIYPNKLALRIEWCKTRARAHRWEEECELLYEEMRRVKEFFRWERNRWISRAIRCKAMNESSEVVEGRAAYAHYQASLRADLVALCEQLWAPTAEWMKTRCVKEAPARRPGNRTDNE